MHRKLLTILAAAFALLCAGSIPAYGATAAPASSVNQPFNVNGWDVGNLIWYNRSVQVGATLYGPAAPYCDAVVYTAYDQYGNQVARQARPGDGTYICGGSLGHGFMLDASTVVGGIRRVVIDIWMLDTSTARSFLYHEAICYRGDQYCTYPV